jgi:membrane protease YdiL (CAAX protease family)
MAVVCAILFGLLILLIGVTWFAVVALVFSLLWALYVIWLRRRVVQMLVKDGDTQKAV